MGLIIAGIIFLILGGVLLYTRKRSLSRALDMKYYERSKVSDLIDTYKHIKTELGEGNYNGNIVELSGITNSDSPLIAEHSQRQVVYYESSITREYEVTEHVKDKDGKYRPVTKRKSELVSKNTQDIPFYLDDGSGQRILVDMKGARKDSIQSIDKFETHVPPHVNVSSSQAGSKTLGYRYKEKIIPIGITLYVLGEISDRRGEISILKPSESGKPFVVSTKSEEELVKAAEGSATWQLVGAIVLAVLGLGLIIGSFFR